MKCVFTVCNSEFEDREIHTLHNLFRMPRLHLLLSPGLQKQAFCQLIITHFI